MIFVLLFFGGLAYLHYGVRKQLGPQGKAGKRTVNTQPISWQAAQRFLQGDENSSGRGGKYTESNRAIAQRQAKVKRGVAGNAGTDRIVADLSDRMSGTFDPQWRMRWANAYNRMVLQSDVDNGRDPSGPLNIDRVSEEVNDDTGQASGFTRAQFTYQDRFRRGRVRAGAGPNAMRMLDQEDPGDQTALQTTLQPNGFKSIIYPRANFDREGNFLAWVGIRIRNLEREYWSGSGRPYNQVGATQSDMPTHKGWLWSFLIPKRGKHGAYPSRRSLPGRSNRFNDSINSGQGTG